MGILVLCFVLGQAGFILSAGVKRVVGGASRKPLRPDMLKIPGPSRDPYDS